MNAWRGNAALVVESAVSQAQVQEALHCGLLGLDVSETT